MSNWKFSELEYKRIDFDAVKKQLEAYTERVKNAKSAEEVIAIYEEQDREERKIGEQSTIVFIRHTLDMADKYYDEESRYLDMNWPTVAPYSIAFNDAVANSQFRPDIEKKYGKQLFAEMDIQKKSFCEENIPLIQRESELTDEYSKLMASCKIQFDGKELNLYGIQKYFEHDDRNVRKAAFAEFSKFYSSNETRLEEIWDELIKIRTQMGKNLGFKDFTPLGYLGMHRTDYGVEDVASFREQVRTELVPFCEKLYEEQAKRLGIDHVMVYDESRIFPDGNAVPAGNDDYMVEEARKMYHDISPETGEFIDYMIEHELMDLKNKPGKSSTGYMTDLQDKLAPFVFSCFNGTIFDMQVLSHELGHAFAGYMAMREQPISNYFSESTDIAEIHSMSMEQFCYPYAEQFFGPLADKYRFGHLQEALTFVPYGVAVDEYQHICYAHPELTPKERTYEWHKLEEKYMPWRKYENDEFMERGGYWYYKLHIFLYPFYYINYTLTTMGAMEFKAKNHENHEKAWADYLNLCKCGGSMSYLETLKYANLSNPFEKGSVNKALAYAKEELMETLKRLK